MNNLEKIILIILSIILFIFIFTVFSKNIKKQASTTTQLNTEKIDPVSSFIGKWYKNPNSQMINIDNLEITKFVNDNNLNLIQIKFIFNGNNVSYLLYNISENYAFECDLLGNVKNPNNFIMINGNVLQFFDTSTNIIYTFTK
jgi:hypothetical protein